MNNTDNSQPYEETLISEYWFRKLIDNKEQVSIEDISAIIAAFAAEFEEFDKLLASGSYEIVNNGLTLQPIAGAKHSMNQAHFGCNTAKSGAKYHWKLKYHKGSFMIFVGVIEADKANIDYTNCISGKGIAYLWYGGGTYYGNNQSESMGNNHIIQPSKEDNEYLHIYLDLMENNKVTFGNEQYGKIYKWSPSSLGQIKKNKNYRLAVVSHSSGGATTVEIIEFNVEYKPIIR